MKRLVGAGLQSVLAIAALSFGGCLLPNTGGGEGVGDSTTGGFVSPVGGSTGQATTTGGIGTPPFGSSTGNATGGFADSGPVDGSSTGSDNVGTGPLQTSGPSQPLGGAADGALAQSVDGTLLYAVSSDDNTLVVVDPLGQSCNTPGTGCMVATVTVGTAPARVIVGSDDTIYVSNRKARSISVIPRPAGGGSWAEARKIATSAEPIGMALSGDGKTLFVANHASGTVQAIVAATGVVTWETTVGDFPRSVAFLPSGKLYVSHYRSGMVDVLDGAAGTILKSVSTNVGVVPSLTVSTDLSGNVSNPTFRSIGLESLVVSHDGTRVYLPHRRERNGMISDRNFVPIVAPALTTFELATDLPHDDALETSADYPPTILFPDNRAVVAQGGDGDGGCFFDADAGEVCPGGGAFNGTGGSTGSSGTAIPIPSDGGTSGGGTSYGGEVAGFGWTQGPVAVVEDAQGAYLFVVNENSGNVVVFPTRTRNSNDAPGGVAGFVTVGNGPTGVVLSHDNQTLYVYNAIDHSISVVTSGSAGLAQTAGLPSNGVSFNIGNSIFQTASIPNVGTPAGLGSDITTGRTLFFSASDSTMSAPGSGVACESCHLEGGTDGNTWQFIQGPRRTMGLLGKNVQNTVPYHWDGTESDIHTLLHDTTTARMGGSGTDLTEDAQISAYLAQLLPYDNPNRLAAGLSTSQAHGQTLFASNCASCHSGSDMTDEGFHDVGTLVTQNPNGNPDDLCRLGVGAVAGVSCLNDGTLPSFPNPDNHGGFNTPTTLGLYFAGPYLHDGSAATLDLVVTKMLTATNLPSLSASDTSDLVAYLETL